MAIEDGGQAPIKHWPLTVEEYAVGGVSLKHCTACGQDKAHNASGWAYYRENGTPKVLCGYCFEQKCEHGTVADAALFVLPDAGTCDYPQDAYRIAGLPQRPPDSVERVFKNFRDLSAEQIRAISVELPSKASVGDCLEWFGPVRWWAILKCLAWLREIEGMPLRFLFQRWAKLDDILTKELPGADHEPWRKRVATVAASEFLFRYSVALSDAVEAAHKKAASQKVSEASRKVFEECKTAACAHAPPASLDGAADELKRFVEYMDATIGRVEGEA